MVAGNLPTGTVTFLFTDIQGSTPLWERDPQRMAVALAIHNSVLRQAIENHGGVVFKTIGDAFQAAFSTASQALEAAIAGQLFLQTASWNELGPLVVRMGIHSGEAQPDATGTEFASGHVFNRVARIMSVAHGGQILLSFATFELLRGILPQGVTLKDLGEHRLKGMLQPEHIFQVIASGLPAEFPTLSSQPKPQQNFYKEIYSRAQIQLPGINVDFLDSAIYSRSLTALEGQDYLKILSFARSLQADNPRYETVYQHLLYLYVLNGSRLGMLKKLDRRLRGLAEGQGALLLISGSSGMGKTSLVKACQERLHQLGAELIPANCFEGERTDYAIWKSAARSIAAITGISIETLPSPIGTGNEVSSLQQLKEAFNEWLRKNSASSRLAILLDDLHWADADSLEILNHLVNQSDPAPILFIATYRSEEVQDRQPLEVYLPQLGRNRVVDHIHLAPLGREDIERLVTAYHGACSPELARYLHDRAAGNPLFTVELLHDLIARDLLPQDQQGFWLPPEQSVPVPPLLTQLITQRLRRLGTSAERLLSIAAVVGERWDLKIIERLSDMSEDELLTALEDALHAEVIADEDERAEIYRFSHGLIREVIYTAQHIRRRKRLHEQIAMLLEGEGVPDIYTIAYHHIEAENWGKAVQACLTAGEQATRRLAINSALQWYQQALNAAERIGSALDPTVRSAIYVRLGRTHIALEQRHEAEIVYSRMRDAAQLSGDLAAEGDALVNLANARMRLYQLDLAENTAQEALKIAEQTGNTRLLTDAHASLGGLFIVRGQLDQARSHFDQVMRSEEQLADSEALQDMLRMHAYLATWEGRYAQAESYARRVLDLAQKSADPLAIAGAYQNICFAQVEVGQYLQAYQNIQATLKAVEVAGSQHHQKPRFMNLMGYLFLELGGAQEALFWDQKALEAVRDTHAQTLEIRRYSLLNQATDYLQLGRLEEAQSTIAQFEAIKAGVEYAYFRYYNRYQLLLCELYLAQGAYDGAVELAHEAHRLAQSKGVLKNVAKSLWYEGQALAGLSRFGEALACLEKAVSIVDEIQHGSLRWKIRLSLAEVLRKAGKSPDAVIRQAQILMDQVKQSLSGTPLQEIYLSSNWIDQLTQLGDMSGNGQ